MTTVLVSISIPAWRRIPGIRRMVSDAAQAALDAVDMPTHLLDRVEIGLDLSDDATVRSLNRQFRRLDAATNVLSFPAYDSLAEAVKAATGHGRPILLGPILLGDVVLAYETVRGEAAEQGKSLLHHTMHLVVHGVLHLLGYDHDSEDRAVLMESLERRILAGFGISDPYLILSESVDDGR